MASGLAGAAHAPERPIIFRFCTKPRSLLSFHHRHASKCHGIAVGVASTAHARQADRELGEFAEPAVDFDCSPVLLGDDVPADRQAEPGALAPALSGKLGTVMENYQLLRRENCLGVYSPVIVRKLDLVCTTAQYFDDGADLAADKPLLGRSTVRATTSSNRMVESIRVFLDYIAITATQPLQMALIPPFLRRHAKPD
jgi:hypothetical protein